MFEQGYQNKDSLHKWLEVLFSKSMTLQYDNLIPTFVFHALSLFIDDTSFSRITDQSICSKDNQTIKERQKKLKTDK